MKEIDIAQLWSTLTLSCRFSLLYVLNNELRRKIIGIVHLSTIYSCAAYILSEVSASVLWYFGLSENRIRIGLMQAETWYKTGHQKWLDGDYQGAITDCTKAIELDSDFYLAYLRRGTAYSALSQFEQALQDYNRVIQLKSDFASAYNNRGNLYTQMEKLEQAFPDYERAIQLMPDNDHYYVNRALAYSRIGQLIKALEDIHIALRLNPDYALAYNNRAAVWMLDKNQVEALKDIKQALKLDPDNKIFQENYRIISQSEGGTEASAVPIIINPRPPALYTGAIPASDSQDEQVA